MYKVGLWLIKLKYKYPWKLTGFQMLETKLELIVKDENTTKTFTLQRPKNDLNQRQNSSSVASVVIECESLEDTKDWVEKIRGIQSKLKWPSFWWFLFPSSNLTFSIVYNFIFWIWRRLNERLYLPGTVTSFLNEHHLTWITDIFLWSNESYILQMKYTWIEYYYDRNVSEIKMAMLGSTRLKNV